MNDNVQLKDDLLKGAAAIAEHVGFDRRAVYHLTLKGRMPHFKLGDTICARKSTLAKWIAEQEARAA